jgi:hypothetical protein
MSISSPRTYAAFGCSVHECSRPCVAGFATWKNILSTSTLSSPSFAVTSTSAVPGATPFKTNVFSFTASTATTSGREDFTSLMASGTDVPLRHAATSSFAPGAMGLTKFSVSTVDGYASVNFPSRAVTRE